MMHENPQAIRSAQEYGKLNDSPGRYGQGLYRYRDIVLADMFGDAPLNECPRRQPVHVLLLAASYHWLADRIASILAPGDTCTVTNFDPDVLSCAMECSDKSTNATIEYALLDANSIVDITKSAGYRRFEIIDSINSHLSAAPIETRLFVTYHFYICTSLEHIERDLALIEVIPRYSSFFFSVPNFGGKTHFRWFDSAEDVHARYSPLLTMDKVRDIVAVTMGRSTKFVCRGRRK